VAREIAGSSTPLVGIHVGRLGFLAEVTAGRLPQAIDQIAEGDFRIENRPLILAEHKDRPTLRALNDFVFARGDVSRIIELAVSVDDEELTQYRCDGLIVSSPTGSTAYSLAAGGAIVSPTASVFAITPICPLTLSNQSVIVDMESTIRVRVCTLLLETHLTADGQVAVKLRHGEEIAIRRAPDEVRLLRLGGSSFFQTLRQKLHWSGSHA
jgi:NAD+ kinase